MDNVKLIRLLAVLLYAAAYILAAVGIVNAYDDAGQLGVYFFTATALIFALVAGIALGNQIGNKRNETLGGDE